MSFAGHVFDMIRRNKEDREKLSQLRGKGKDMRTKYSSHIQIINVTPPAQPSGRSYA